MRFDFDAVVTPAIVERLFEGTEEAFAGEVGRCALDALIPNAPMRAVEWIEDNLIIPPGISERSGPVRLSAVMRDMLDQMQEPGVTQMALLKTPRSESSTALACFLIYKVVHEGKDVVFYERSEDHAQSWHDKKLWPIIEASTKIHHMLRPDGRSGVQDGWSDRYFRNGACLQIRGVQVDGAFNAIRGQIVVADEAGDEAYIANRKNSKGSKIDQARTRLQEFYDGVLYVGGTPTIPGTPVSEEHDRGDQRLWMMRFPCCGVEAPFVEHIAEWSDAKPPPGAGLRFTCERVTTEDGRAVERIQDVWYQCGCGKRIAEKEKVALIESGRSVATRTPESPGFRSMHFWSALSYDPKSSWPIIAEKWLASERDPSLRQTFANLWRGRDFIPEVAAGVRTSGALETRCEPYPATCPQGVLYWTAGGDSQAGRAGDDARPPRHEIVVVGWGAGEEAWVLGRFVITRRVDPKTGEIEFVDPYSPAAAEEIERVLSIDWTRPDGTKPEGLGMMADVSWEMSKALPFFSTPLMRKLGVIPVRGANESKGSRRAVVTRKPSRYRRTHEYVYLGMQRVMDEVYSRITIREPGPGYMHFPLRLAGTDFFTQLTSMVPKEVGGGRTWWDVWKPGADNEVIDCYGYAYACLQSHKLKTAKVREAIGGIPAKPVTDEAYEGPDLSYVGPHVLGAPLGMTVAAPGQTAAKVEAQPSAPSKPVSARERLEMMRAEHALKAAAAHAEPDAHKPRRVMVRPNLLAGF